MAYPNRYFRRLNLTRDKVNGVIFDPGKLDAEFNDIAQVLQQQNDYLRAGFTANRFLKPTTPPTAQDLASLTRFVATAAQTAFTVPTYDNVQDVVMVWSGASFIDTALIVQTNATTVTLPAQTLGTVITIGIFTSGSGTLTRLADNVTVDEGAALVGVRDAGGLLASTDVESALAEIMGTLNTFTGTFGSFTDYVKADGSVPFTDDQPMGNNALTGLRASVANGESVRHEQLQAVIAQITGITSAFLAKTGGTMAGIIDHGGFRATNVGTPVDGGDAANKIYVDGQLLSFGGLPIGSVTDYAGASIPSGWLLADGSAVSRATYANLFTVIGVAFGVGDGTTTFNLPDAQGRVTIGTGAGSGLTSRSLNDKAGEETHLLDVTEMPAHTHGIIENTTDSGQDDQPLNDGTNGAATGTTTSTGGGLAHNNMPPYIALRKIIKF